MGIIGLFVFGMAGVLGLDFWRRMRALDRDRDQHHLASMLISIAAGRDEIDRDDVIAFLRAPARARPHAIARLNHAVKLAGTAVSGEAYDRVVALARAIGAAA